MTTWHGWAGTILNVDLSAGTISRTALDRDYAAKYLGGLGFATRVLYDEVGPETDPFSPANIIAVAPGALSGTISPASGRCDLVSKSPMTGIFIRSNLGGFFAPELKWAGYDLVVVRGQAEGPVYLWIKDKHVELRDAGHLWGKDTWTTERMLREELGDHAIKTLKIGPAGEHQCFSAAVIGDLGRAAGKASIAAVWGAKKLKAIAVRGTSGTGIARPAELVRVTHELWERISRDPMYRSHTTYGTNTWVGDTIMRKSEGRYPMTSELTSTGLSRLYEKNLSCGACALHCSHFYRIPSGKYAGTAGEGIEGNTQIMGAALGINSAAFILHYNNVCNQLGLDTMHPAAAFLWATRLYREGLITREDTGGMELATGNEELVLNSLRQIAYKEGIGPLLDGYPIRAAQRVGKGEENTISHNKRYSGGGAGLVISMKMTLAHAVSTRGHDHLIGSPAGLETPGRQPEVTDEVLRAVGQQRYGDPNFFFEPVWAPSPRHARRVFECENLFAIADMTGTCKFAQQYELLDCGLALPDFSRLLTAATGVELGEADIVKAAEREMLLERAFNNREGMRRIDDHPHAFWYQLKYGKPHPKYPAPLPTTLQDYGKALEEYYRLRGCDPATGVPTASKLREVGLEDVADDLQRRGILAS